MVYFYMVCIGSNGHLEISSADDTAPSTAPSNLASEHGCEGATPVHDPTGASVALSIAPFFTCLGCTDLWSLALATQGSRWSAGRGPSGVAAADNLAPGAAP
jgi:hypothetical protein